MLDGPVLWLVRRVACALAGWPRGDDAALVFPSPDRVGGATCWRRWAAAIAPVVAAAELAAAVS